MNKYFKLLITCITVCIVILVGLTYAISPKSVKTTRTLKFNSIKSAQVYLGGIGESRINYRNLNLNNSKEAKDIKDILKYLRIGKLQGYSDEKVISKGGSPAYLNLKLKNGSIIQIETAKGGKITKLNNGVTAVYQFNIPNEVKISTNLSEPSFRLSSVKLRKLIDNILK